MDRFTWGFAGGAIVLCFVALGSVMLTRRTARPDVGTPGGVVAAYVQAVRDRDADRAWALLAPDATIGGVALAGPDSRSTTRADFERAIASLPGRQDESRVRVLDTRQNGDSATVPIEVTTSSGGPLFGSDLSQTFTFTLAQSPGEWRIKLSPTLYEIGD